MRVSGDRGFSLISITWIVLLLALLASGVLTFALRVREDVAGYERAESERLLVESALDVFMHRYFFNTEAGVYQSGTVSLEDAQIDVHVQFQSGLININRSGFEVLSAAFVALGKSEEEALSIADAILDWRDTDSLRRQRGAEQTEYQAKDALGPRNGPFETIGELVHVEGIDEYTLNCLLPVVTTSSLSSFPEIEFAGDEVRQILQWAYTSGWQDYAWHDPEAAAQTTSVSGADSSSLSGRTMRVELAVRGGSGRTYSTDIRFGSLAARDIEYELISPIRMIEDNEGASSCFDQ